MSFNQGYKAQVFRPCYTPLSQVAFANEPIGGIVKPHELPPSSYRFPTVTDQDMNNLPDMNAGVLISGYINRRRGMRI